MISRTIIIFIILLCFGFPLSAQTATAVSDSTNQVVGNKREGKWVIVGKDQEDLKYSSTQVVEEGIYSNGRKEGIWVRYYPNGKKKSEIHYENGRPSGTFKLYYENGNLEEEGKWVNRVYNGSFKRYYENGVLEQEKTFDQNGKAEGQIVYYYPNGQKELEYTSLNGKEIGKATRYYPNGDIKEVISFNDGEALTFENKEMVSAPVEVKKEDKTTQKKSPKAQGAVNQAHKEVQDGYAKRFNKNNDILMDGEFKNNKLWNGKWYKYDNNGLLLKIEIYKNGKFEGNGVIGS